jgi:hypothetical protein
LVYDNIDKTSYEEERSDEDTEFSSNYDITRYFPRGDTGSIIITTRLQRLMSLGSQVHLRKLDVHDGLLILEKHVGRSLKRTGSHTASNNSEIDEWDLGSYFLFSLRMRSVRPCHLYLCKLISPQMRLHSSND